MNQRDYLMDLYGDFVVWSGHDDLDCHYVQLKY